MSRYPDIGQHRSQKKTVAPDKLPACRTNPPPERILPLPSEDPAAAANTKTGKQPTARVKQPAH